MRLFAILIPVGLVGTFLAIQARPEHRRVVVVPEAPAPVVVQTAPRVAVAPRAARVAAIQEAGAASVTIDLAGLEATIEAALSAAAEGLEAAELSMSLTEGILEAVVEILEETSVSIEGELELVTEQGERIVIRASDDGHLMLEAISN